MKIKAVLLLFPIIIMLSGCTTFALTRGLYRSAVPHYEYKKHSVYEASGAYCIVIAKSVNFSKDKYNVTIKSKSDGSIKYDDLGGIREVVIDYPYHKNSNMDVDLKYIDYDALKIRQGVHPDVVVKKWTIKENGVERPFLLQSIDESSSSMYFTIPFYPITVALDIVFGPFQVYSQLGNTYGAGNH